MIKYPVTFNKFRWNAVFNFDKNYRISGTKRCLTIRFGHYFYIIDLWNLRK